MIKIFDIITIIIAVVIIHHIYFNIPSTLKFLTFNKLEHFCRYILNYTRSHGLILLINQY